MTSLLRRRLLIGLGGAGALAGIGGAAAVAVAAQETAAYRAAVAATWRHSESFDPSGPALMRELVRYATLAANSHNTQPWTFRPSNRAILIQPDFGRRLAAVDPDDHHLFASLGCATENLVQAAAAFGFHATAVFDPEARGVRVDLDKSPPLRSDLFEAIPRRQSTRGLFDGRLVPPEHLALLEAAGGSDGVTLLMVTERKPIENILSWLLAADSAEMENPAFVAELKSWIRFDAAEALTSRDGLFAKASGNPTLPGWLGRRIFSLVVTAAGENAKYAAQLRSSAGVAVFVSGRDEPAGWSAAGRASQRFALQATSLGIRTAFINQPVEVAALRGPFGRSLGLGDRRPDLVLRFGYGAELPRSLRRPVAQVIVPDAEVDEAIR
jgi:nitroreductase